VYKVITHNLLNCRTIYSCWNNLEQVCRAQQSCSKLSTSWEQAVRTHPVHKLLEQHCYKSAAGLLHLVPVYACILAILHDVPESVRFSFGSDNMTIRSLISRQMSSLQICSQAFGSDNMTIRSLISRQMSSLQICSQAVDMLCSHCLFLVVVTSLEQAVNNL
jgi:hypothetical protein